jgi:hypothetical protein
MRNKGFSLEKCIKLGTKFISEDNICLIGFDVKEFTKIPYPKNVNLLREMVDNINEKFSHYLPVGRFNDPATDAKGFQIYRGDSAIAQINSIEGIKEIMDYQKENYSTMPLHWRIAKQGNYKELF